MNAVLYVLLEIIIYSVVLFGALLLFKKVFKKQLSAVMQYAVWFLLILRLLVPVTIDSGVRLFVMPQPQTQVIQELEQPADANSANAPSGSNYINQAEEAAQSNPQPNLNAQIADQEKYDQIKNTNWKINWQWILIMVWAAGMGITFSYTAFLWTKLEHRLKKKGVFVSESIRILIGKCKKELGIKADIQTIIFGEIASPALTASIRPKLLLPYGIEEQMDAKQIEFILMHELTHYKRGDHIISLLLVALRCVYWFNPVVWLAFVMIRTDMEAACDAKVASRLDQIEQKRYITTIIDLGGASRAQYMLGMGLRGRRSMEKRIQGIYLRKKTKASARFAALILSLVMGMLCFTTACQPVQADAYLNPGVITPEKVEPIQPIETTNQGEASEEPAIKYESLSHWLEKTQNGKLTIDIDTDVMTPQVENYPMVLVEPVILPQEEIDRLVNYFAAEKKLYKWTDVLTKADWQIRLDNVPEENLIEEVMKYYEDKIENAPKNLPKEYTDTKLMYQLDYNGNAGYYLNVGVENRDKEDAQIKVSNFGDGCKSTGFSYMCGSYVKESIYQDPRFKITESLKDALESIQISKEEAMAKAEKVISDLQIQDMQLVNAEKALLFSIRNAGGNPKSAGYIFEYVRESGGIPGFGHALFTAKDPLDDKQPDYIPPYDQETLSILVTAEGIEYFSWIGRVNEVKTISPSVSLLSLAQIQEKLKDKIYERKKLELTNENLENFTVKVYSAQLCMFYINDQENPKRAKMVPAWVFGTKEIIDFSTDEKTIILDGPHYIINAMDGGLVGWMGYSG